MIGSLRGTVLEVTPRQAATAEVLVEVGGVGYQVVVPAGAVGRVGPAGSATFLHVHTHVREDALVLYGFPSREERVCFEALIGAHGVGPAAALALLSVHSPAALHQAVFADDADALMLVPGIGRKTASRLLIELKARLDNLDGVAVLDGTGTGKGPAAAGPADGGGAGDAAVARAEVRAALAGLGYGAEEIREVLASVPAEGTVESQLRRALRGMAGAR